MSFSGQGAEYLAVIFFSHRKTWVDLWRCRRAFGQWVSAVPRTPTGRTRWQELGAYASGLGGIRFSFRARLSRLCTLKVEWLNHLLMSVRRWSAPHFTSEAPRGLNTGVLSSIGCAQHRLTRVWLSGPSCALLPQGETWSSAMKGHDLGVDTVDQDKKRLLLERFQTEVCHRSHLRQFTIDSLWELNYNLQGNPLCFPLYKWVIWASMGVGSFEFRISVWNQIRVRCRSCCDCGVLCLQHPGFDFSGAEISGGDIPNARTFLKELDAE